jgi:hypothetical protein
VWGEREVGVCSSGGGGFEPLLSRVVIETVTFRPFLSFFLAVVLLEIFDSFPATLFVQRYLISSGDIAFHTHPGCVSCYCSRCLACAFARVSVLVRACSCVCARRLTS